MFKKQEAFDFINKFLEIENVESRLETNKRELLDDIVYRLGTRLPFQNISLLSVPHDERRKPTPEEVKANCTSGRGGLCFDINISTFHLLSAIGYEVNMLHTTVSTTTISRNNHVLMVARNLEKEGDSYLVDVACGHPTLRIINLDFEKESPIYMDSYLEYKFIKLDGSLLRMHRRGDPLVSRGVQENSEIEFWIDGWRRFYIVHLDVETKNPAIFDQCHEEVYTNPTASPFHLSIRVVTFPQGKASMVVNDKTFTDVDGNLVIAAIEGGDEALESKIKEICPSLPHELIPRAIQHWRQSMAASASRFYNQM